MVSPTDLTGLTVWLDASQLTQADGVSIGTQWSDLSGGGHHGAVVGSPAPVVKTNALNGKRVVRFAAHEGRIRGNGMCTAGSYDLTVLYIGRMWGTNLGRIFTNTYPPYNFLVGTYSGSAYPGMYDNGWVGPTPASLSGPSQWMLYGGVCTSSLQTLYVNGATAGTGASSNGHDSLWNLSGYDATADTETCDCEIAELVVYNRALTTTERQAIENYLSAKWFPPVLDDFNRANSSITAGTDWINRNNTMGISDNAAYGVVSGAWNVASYNTPATANDMEASIRLGVPAGDLGWDFCYVGIGFNAAGEGVFVDTNAIGGGFSIYTQTDWALGGLVNQANLGATWVIGDILTIKRAGNIYTVYKNGVNTGLNWTDSGGLVPIDSSHRTAAIGAYENGTGSRRIDSFTASPVGGAIPTPVSATLTGAGALSATTFASYPRAAALTGAGTLSATTVKVAPVSAALAGAGTLSATTVKVALVSAALAGAGAFSGSAMMFIAFGGIPPATGSLSAIIAIGTGVYPDVTGVGTLSAMVYGIVPKTASLSGSGALSARMDRALPVAWSGGGVLVTATQQIYSKQPALSGGGTLADPAFYGTGFKSVDANGTGTVSATWMARPFVYPVLASAGTMAATLGMQYLRNGLLAGDGALAEAHKQIYAPAATLSGDGVLVATDTQLYALAPGLSGDGTLSATVDVPALVVISTLAVTAATMSLPPHAPGDLLLVLGVGSAGTTMSAAAAGGTVPTWNTIDTSGANPGTLLAWAVATASNHTTGSWTSATPASMCAIVLRNQAPGSPIGGHAKTSGQSVTPVVAPAITMAKTNGTSMLLHFIVSRCSSGNAAWPVAPAGYIRQLTHSPVPAYPTSKLAINSKNDTTSDGACSQPTGDSAAPIGAQGFTVEILRR